VRTSRPFTSKSRTVTAARAELATLEQLTTDTTARRQSLECSCDLADENALAEITRLQVMEALLPRRIFHREEARNLAETGLLAASHEFIYQQLGPRIRAMIVRAKAKATAELSSHFSDKDELERVVNKSVLVAELEGFSHYATVRNEPADRLVPYAEQLLRTWAECDAREAKLA
jgi:hypothetical protein